MRKLLPLSEDKQGPRTRHGYEADLWHMAVMMKSEQGAVPTGPTAVADGYVQRMYVTLHSTQSH